MSPYKNVASQGLGVIGTRRKGQTLNWNLYILYMYLCAVVLSWHSGSSVRDSSRSSTYSLR